MGPKVVLEVASDESGVRVDRFLAARLDDVSRSRVQDLIRSGCVSGRGGKILEAGGRVKHGDVYEVVVPPPAPAGPVAEDIALTVMHEDADIIVVDKPAGMVVHPAAGHQAGTLVNALLAHCGESLSGIGGERRPGIVHRLDKDTSGVLVVAKTDTAHRGLSGQFAAHGRDGRLERRYIAFAWGVPLRRRGLIDAPLGRSVTNRKKMAVPRGGQGRAAVTEYEVAETFTSERSANVACRLDLRLQTGRTHQIRVHLAHAGHPILGDATYGAGFKASAALLDASARDALAALNRQALHAAVLAFEHPMTGRKLRFESPLPADIARLHVALRGMNTADRAQQQRETLRRRPR